MENNNVTTELSPSTPIRRFGRYCATFVRWVFIALFVLILAGGVYFKAPWKVLVMTAFPPVLLTIIPNPSPKSGWLILVTVIVWIFVPETDTGIWRSYSFDEEIKAYNAKYEVPDKKNAAVILEKISLKYDDTFYTWPDFSDLEKPKDPNAVRAFIGTLFQQIKLQNSEFYPDSWTEELDKLTLQQPWKSNDYPELADWLEKNNEDIQSLIKASKKPTCRFQFTFALFPPSTFNDGPEFAICEWLDLLQRAANNDWADGRINDALKKYSAIFKLSKLLSQQPSWTLAYTGFRKGQNIHDSLSHFIIENDLNEKQLNILSKAIRHTEPDWKSCFDKWTEYNTLDMKQLCAMMYEVNEAGEVRHARSTSEVLSKLSFKETKSLFEKQQEKIGTIIAWFMIPTTPQALSKQIDSYYDCMNNIPLTEFEKHYTSIDIQFDQEDRLIANMVRSDIKSYCMVYQGKEHYTLYNNVYQVYIALKKYKNKYGNWPEQLSLLNEFISRSMLLDPFNNDTLIYKKNGADFKLYSKGKNGIDEEGLYQRPVYDPNQMTKEQYYELEPEPDDILLWPAELE